ncbi:hypothetical protein KAT92_04505 [Candidatus Babeliales bacterium]|nr:hypothetical protein [Candidatus Babeliales bacterium]
MDTFEELKNHIHCNPKYSSVRCERSDIDSSQRWEAVVCLSACDLDKAFTDYVGTFRPGVYWKIGPNLDHLKICIPPRQRVKDKYSSGKASNKKDDPQYWLPLLYLLGMAGLSGLGAFVTERQDWSFLF